MGPDHDVDRARRQAFERARALRALSLPVRSASRSPAGCGERRQRGKMLARENFGRRPSAPPGVRPRPRSPWRGARRGSCRIRHRPAGAAACGSRSARSARISVERFFLRGGEPERQGGDDLFRETPVAAVHAARGALHPRPNEDERELAREQLVEGEANPRRAVGGDRLRALRAMDGAQSFREGGQARERQPSRVVPFRQDRNFSERAVDGLGEKPRRQALRRAIDRLDRRHPREAFRIEHAVRMDDLPVPVPKLELSRDPACRADRQSSSRSKPDSPGRTRGARRRSRPRRAPCRAPWTVARAGGARRPSPRSSRSCRASLRRSSGGCGGRSSQ